MRWRGRRQSTRVEDRRGRGPVGKGVGIGGGKLTLESLAGRGEVAMDTPTTIAAVGVQNIDSEVVIDNIFVLDQGRLVFGILREHLLQGLRCGLVPTFENIEPDQVDACRTKTGVFRKDGIQQSSPALPVISLVRSSGESPPGRYL